MATGDVRKVRDTLNKIDLAFIFNALHSATVGVKQLHSKEIAHQDLKPSNLLSFEEGYKITDLGRSSDKNNTFKYDKYVIPGDPSYAPIEQLYGFRCSNDFNEKYAADLFLLGSLFLFFFTNLSALEVYMKKAKNMSIAATESFETDLPEWERVFTEIIVDFKNSLKQYIRKEEDIEEVATLFKYLCCPDPRKRGFPKRFDSKINQYNLERFISRLDFFAKKAEQNLL
jgi:serine/threonine protein kinase